jgi:hypothetical protein
MKAYIAGRLRPGVIQCNEDGFLLRADAWVLGPAAKLRKGRLDLGADDLVGSYVVRGDICN